ncbi:helix-turn-helix domain-containing protein [Mammaliicoccus sciuri]|uniref:helix-turn-helix domain-containing protein n=1 Tax=Mammaliicoccus sciuri TaxID=1296 RepID=UPI000D1DA4A7|nr:helix-turn-helix transcriptional regulator [Mammaliicoccus sciuri]PTK00485.1 hypothetical protein BUZ87_12020 [Mammaliicoccus sciuri]
MREYLEAGQIIKNERIEHGIALSKIAEYMHKSSPFISMIENGKSNPNSDFIYDFSKAIYNDNSNDTFYNDLVAEKYIELCLKTEREIKLNYPKVKKKLFERGLLNNDNILDKPYFSLNWLLTQNDNPLTFGVKYDFPKKLNKDNILPINSYDYFNQTLKDFILLNEEDNKIIYGIIESYIINKYEDDILKHFEVKDNDLIYEATQRKHNDESNENSIRKLSTIDELMNQAQNKFIPIRKNWKINNETNLDFIFTNNNITLINEIAMENQGYYVIGDIYFNETKTTLNNFKIEVPDKYQITIDEDNREITIKE